MPEKMEGKLAKLQKAGHMVEVIAYPNGTGMGLIYDRAQLIDHNLEPTTEEVVLLAWSYGSTPLDALEKAAEKLK